MGNTISSAKTVVVTSMKKGVFSRYVEFSEKCSKYQFECKSFPVVESIVNNAILFPCQVLVLSPIIAYGAITNFPLTVASHCFTVFKLGAPVLSTQYIYTMTLIRLGYNIPYLLHHYWKELCRYIKNYNRNLQLYDHPAYRQEMDRQLRFWDNVWRREDQYRQRMDDLYPNRYYR